MTTKRLTKEEKQARMSALVAGSLWQSNRGPGVWSAPFKVVEIEPPNELGEVYVVLVPAYGKTKRAHASVRPKRLDMIASASSWRMAPPPPPPTPRQLPLPPDAAVAALTKRVEALEDAFAVFVRRAVAGGPK